MSNFTNKSTISFQTANFIMNCVCIQMEKKNTTAVVYFYARAA